MIDWKAFEDGSMPADERERLLRELEGNARLRSDYEGYLAFVHTLRAQVHREPVPTINFTPVRQPLIRRPFMFAGTAAAVAALIFLRPPATSVPASSPDISIANTPEIARLETRNPTEASKWLMKRTGLDAPVIDVPTHFRVAVASYGMDWSGYDFTCKEGTLQLRFAGRDSFESCSTVTLAGQVFYQANGIGWRQDGLSFLLTGSKGAPLQDYAKIMHREISLKRKLSVAPVQGAK